MAKNKNRKLRGAILTGALVAPAVMSAAQQNVVSADLSSFLSSAKKWGSWALNGAKQVIKSAWSTTYGKIGLCTLALVGSICLGYGLGYLLHRFILDDKKISFSDTEFKNCIYIAKQFKDIFKKTDLSDSLVDLLVYLKNTEKTEDISIKLLVAKKGQDEGNNKLQTKTVSKSACVRALKKTLEIFGKALDESQEEFIKLSHEKAFGELFTDNLRNEGAEGLEENEVIAGFQISKFNKKVLVPRGKRGEIYSAGLNNFKEVKVDENRFFDKNYESFEIKPYEIKEK